MSPNVRAVLFPLIAHRRTLRERGLQWCAFTRMSPEVLDCDCLVMEGKFYGARWRDEEHLVLDEIAGLATRVPRLVYLETTANTAVGNPGVLPLVERYFKLQLLKDRSLYAGSFYGNRLFTDDCHRNFGIHDRQPIRSQPVTSPAHRDKLAVWWNSSLADYSRMGRYRMEAYARLGWPAALLSFPGIARPAGAPRNAAVSCRMSTNYARETVSWHRKKAREHLTPWTSTNRISHAGYWRELCDSRIVVSPFGWGEICYRDYETFLAGALLVKPDMSHLETWPDLYREHTTYEPYQWDGQDLRSVVENALSNPEHSRQIAMNGQTLYREQLSGETAAERFCDRIIGLVGA